MHAYLLVAELIPVTVTLKVVFDAEYSFINSDRSQLLYITAYILEACFNRLVIFTLLENC